MLDVFNLQVKRMLRKPVLILMFLGLTIVMVFVQGGAPMGGSVNVPVYSEDATQEELNEWVERLNESDEVQFETSDYDTVEEDIRMNRIAFALEIDTEEVNYRYLTGRDSEHMPIVDQHVYQVFNEYNRLEEIRADFPDEEIEVNQLIGVEESQSDAFEQAVTSSQLGMIIGMTMYFTMYTVFFLQTNLVEEKRKGTWDRLITSPVSKVKVYLGNLVFYFLIGVAQVLLSVFILASILGINFGTNYLPAILVILSFIFTIISIGILLVAIVKSPEALQVTIPLVTTSMAMLGGAFWPLDIIDNDILLFIAEFMPIKHGLNGTMDAITSQASVGDLTQPIGILLLIGVLFMGVGLNLMERQAKS